VAPTQRGVLVVLLVRVVQFSRGKL
jgi:hypothetical protein